MKQPDFISLCRAIGSGERKYVKNLDTLETGRVLACAGDRIEVMVTGRFETWGSEECLETKRPSARFGR